MIIANMKKIEKIREKLGWSVAQFLERKKIGITRQTYYNLIDGKHEPRLSTVKKLSVALEIPVDTIIKY